MEDEFIGLLLGVAGNPKGNFKEFLGNHRED